MRYHSSNPTHAPFLKELEDLTDFNNLYLHLPGEGRSWHQQLYELNSTLDDPDVSDGSHLLPSLWDAIDTFIAQTKFDVHAFEKQKKQGEVNLAIHDAAQYALIPMYLYLRRHGFSKERIIR